MEIIENETNPPEQSEQDALYQARVESATRTVRQAEEELAKAETDDQKVIWQNRLEQRREALRRVINREVIPEGEIQKEEGREHEIAA
ncbi:MAG: hypothetical protein AAB638_00940 [Patescibacteria group bacterium]